MRYRIDPTAASPEPLPPTSGQWVRDADGGLSPLDRETAHTAGLAWPGDPEPAEEPAEEAAVSGESGATTADAAD